MSAGGRTTEPWLPRTLRWDRESALRWGTQSPPLLEALAAVHRTALRGLEGNRGFLQAHGGPPGREHGSPQAHSGPPDPSPTRLKSRNRYTTYACLDRQPRA